TLHSSCFDFFFHASATSELYTLSLHDALPIFGGVLGFLEPHLRAQQVHRADDAGALLRFRDRRVLLDAHALALGDVEELLLAQRSEEHTSELQSLAYLVCRLLLEKKKKD